MCAAKMNSDDVRDVNARRSVAHLDRRALEDKCLTLMEESLLLKRHAKLQEEKMRKMATKLLKLSSEDKRLVKEDGGHRRLASLESEEALEDLHSHLRAVEKENTRMKNKLMVMKLQSESSRKTGPYNHVTARVSTGKSHKSTPGKPPIPSERREEEDNTRTVTIQSASPRYGHSLLEDARRDNLHLEEVALQQKAEVARLQRSLDTERLSWKEREAALTKDISSLQRELEERYEQVQRNAIGEDVVKIRLQRELQNKTVRLEAAQTQCEVLERNLSAVKTQNTRLLEEVEALNQRVKQELSERVAAGCAKSSSTHSQKAFAELEEMVADLRREKDLLRQANERLIQSTFDASRAQQVQELLERVSELEGREHMEKVEKKRLLEKFAAERATTNHLREELSQLRGSHHSVQDECEQLKQKVDQVTRGGAILWNDIEEAVAYINSRKNRGLPMFATQTSPLTNENKELVDLRLKQAETSAELEQVKRILSNQKGLVNSLREELEGKLSHCRSLDEEVASCRQVIQEREAEISQMRQQAQEFVLHRSTLRSRAVQTLEVELRPCSAQTHLSGIDAELRTHGRSEARAIQVVPHVTNRHVQVDLATVGMTTANSVTNTQPHMPDRHVQVDLATVGMATPSSVTNAQPHISPLSHESMDNGEGSRQSEGSEETDLSDVEEEFDTPTDDDDDDDTPTSNILVMASAGAVTNMAHSLAITIISLAVNPDSWVARDTSVEQLFVEYQFLNYNETELETPISLPKPKPGQSACFNFRQVFSLHPDHNAEARNELAAMLHSHDPDAGRVTFTAVSDPVSAEVECVEVGEASVDIREILREQRDITRKPLPLYSLERENGEVVGQLTVTIEAISLFRELMGHGQ